MYHRPGSPNLGGAPCDSPERRTQRGKCDDVLRGRLGVGFRLGQTNEPARLLGLHALCGVATKKLLFARMRLDGSFLGGYVLDLIADVFWI